MHSLSTIRRQNREAAERAAKQDKRPLLVNENDWLEWGLRLAADKPPGIGIPLIPTDYAKDLGFTPITTLFVDKSGLGNPNEPALTAEQFIAKGLELTREHGPLCWTIHSEGQFQLYATAYTKADDRIESYVS